MTSTEKKYLLYGGLGVAAIVGYLYWKSKQAPPTTPPTTPTPPTPTLPSTALGSSTTMLQTGQIYTFGGMIPAGTNTAADLAAVLKTAGWLGISIYGFAAQGVQTIPGFNSGNGMYIASATWNGVNSPTSSGAPSGVIAFNGNMLSAAAPLMQA